MRGAACMVRHRVGGQEAFADAAGLRLHHRRAHRVQRGHSCGQAALEQLLARLRAHVAEDRAAVIGERLQVPGSAPRARPSRCSTAVLPTPRRPVEQHGAQRRRCVVEGSPPRRGGRCDSRRRAASCAIRPGTGSGPWPGSAGRLASSRAAAPSHPAGPSARPVDGAARRCGRCRRPRCDAPRTWSAGHRSSPPPARSWSSSTGRFTAPGTWSSANSAGGADVDHLVEGGTSRRSGPQASSSMALADYASGAVP